MQQHKLVAALVVVRIGSDEGVRRARASELLARKEANDDIRVGLAVVLHGLQ